MLRPTPLPFNHRRFRVTAASLALVVVLLGGWGGPLGAKTRPKAKAGPVIVVLKHLMFSPMKVTIKPGQTVEWKWEDAPVPHDVAFTGFRSPMKTHGTWSHTFKRRGVYTYQCTIHVGMVGTVVVR